MIHFRFVMILMKSMFEPQQDLLEDHCSDLLMVAGRGDGLKVHRLVLAAHSPGLAAMLGEGTDLLLLPEVVVQLWKPR